MNTYMPFEPHSQPVSDLRRAEDSANVAERIARAQALARKYVPKGVSLADELIDERRREAARER